MLPKFLNKTKMKNKQTKHKKYIETLTLQQIFTLQHFNSYKKGDMV